MYNFYLDEKIKKQKIIENLDKEEKKALEDKHRSKQTYLISKSYKQINNFNKYNIKGRIR